MNQQTDWKAMRRVVVFSIVVNAAIFTPAIIILRAWDWIAPVVAVLGLLSLVIPLTYLGERSSHDKSHR